MRKVALLSVLLLLIGVSTFAETLPYYGTGFNGDLTVIPITLALKGVLPMGTFEPYAIGGIGLYYAEAVGSDSLGSINTDDTAFGYFLGLGANFNLTKEVFLGVEGKYFWAEPNIGRGDKNIDGINLTANIGLRY